MSGQIKPSKSTRPKSKQRPPEYFRRPFVIKNRKHHV
nr:MAG TPA: hypothetical protein [Bacteriophage sp.]DAQ81554.1 MAG TPA: hypothetical protein [Caudoviricetes sp.]DAS69835.1 MAG TPA: hypothetical protein [Caudoviricetes sp.]